MLRLGSSSPWFLFSSTDFHVKVLQKNHKVLVNELCIRGPVIDDLIENEAIYHSDQETIMSCGSQKDQIRSLLMCLSRYGEDNFLKFVKALDTERPDLAKNLHGDFERQKSEHSEENITCIKCCIYNLVDIKDVVDDLYSKGLVDYSFLDRTLATPVRNARRQLWNEVFLRMRSETDDNRNKYYEALKDDILKKYKSVFSHFPDFDINENTMKCLCKGKSYAESTSSNPENDLPSSKLQNSAEVEETPSTPTVTQVRRRPKLRKRRNVTPKSRVPDLLLANVLHKWFKSFHKRQNTCSTDLSFGLSEDARNSQIINEDPAVLRKQRIFRYKEDSGFASCEMSSVDVADEKKNEDSAIRRVTEEKASEKSTCTH